MAFGLFAPTRAMARRGSRLWRGILLALFLLSGPAWAQARAPAVSKEFQIKAVFLYNFAQFVEWPAEAFDGPGSPLVIGVLGLDPFGDFLDELVKGEVVNGRPIVVRRYRWIGEVDACHVLFISGSEGAHLEQIEKTIAGRSILTVCDWEGLMRHGGMIRLFMSGRHVRLQINLAAARAAGLTISSKLLRSAEQVIAGHP